MLTLAIIAMYSVFYFVGIYFTMVEGYAASKAGVQLLYYIPGLGSQSSPHPAADSY